MSRPRLFNHNISVRLDDADHEKFQELLQKRPGVGESQLARELIHKALQAKA